MVVVTALSVIIPQQNIFLMQDSGIQDSGIFSQTFESPFVDEIMDQDNAFTRLKRDAEKISYLNYLFREYRSTLTIN